MRRGRGRAQQVVIARRATRDGLERQEDTSDGQARLTSTNAAHATERAAVPAAVWAVSGGGGVSALRAKLEPPPLDPVQSKLEGAAEYGVGIAITQRAKDHENTSS